MNRTFLEYFRCPDHFATFELGGQLSEDSGFFQFGQDTICYGRCSGVSPSKEITDPLFDASRSVSLEGERVRLPFDLSQIVDNLRHERYMLSSRHSLKKIVAANISRRIYYLLRPILHIPVRRRLQKMRLRGWDKIGFPHWPVDFTVESLMEKGMALLLKSRKVEKIPFIWFWPEGYPSCAIMTHDVEANAGQTFCGELMNLDDSFGIKSSFQIVPEVRYEMSNGFLESIRSRNCEVNVHDLNHDGSLFREKREFLLRAKEINRYVKEFRTKGFRAGAMYRNQEWYDAFEFSYDMSVPNVAHLEPQRGGCCTVMPYLIGEILELPLTTIQDYSLFHILDDYSIEIWKQQIELIFKRNGLISFITHPDYLIEKQAQEVYRDLLAHLARLRKEGKLWMTLPGEVDVWWRNRREMQLVQEGDSWRIEGPDKERARIGFATLEGDRLKYELNRTP